MPTQEIEFFRNDMLSFQGHSPWEGESEVEMNVQKVYRRMVARLTLVEEANEGARSRGRSLRCSRRDWATSGISASYGPAKLSPVGPCIQACTHPQRRVLGCWAHNKLSISAYQTIKS